jgi:hypothetical protein
MTDIVTGARGVEALFEAFLGGVEDGDSSVPLQVSL